MTDQASTLRIEKLNETEGSNTGSCRVLSFTSGKGGVGKSTSLVNTAVELTSLGRKVLVFDADLALANIDILIGLELEKTLEDVIAGHATLPEVLVTSDLGFDVLPSASGTEWMAGISWEERMALMRELEAVARDYDYLLVDTPAGLGPEVLFFNAGAHEVVCVVTHEPTSLTDAYGLIKVLSRRYHEKEIGILINQAKGEKHAKNTFKRLSGVVDQYLQVSLNFRGWIPSDSAVTSSIEVRRPVTVEFPSSTAARQFSRLAERIDTEFHALKLKGGLQMFFRQLVEMNG